LTEFLKLELFGVKLTISIHNPETTLLELLE